MTTYIVRPGDTLGTIAQKFLGSSSKWREVWEANSNTISNPDVINVGQVINIPGTTSTNTTQTAIKPALTASRPAYEPIIPDIESSFMDKIKNVFKNKIVIYAGIGTIGLLAVLFIMKKK